MTAETPPTTVPSIEDLDPSAAMTWLQTDGLDWLRTVGMDLGIKILTAIAIVFIGRWIVRLLVKAVRTGLQKAEVDVTLERFVCTLVNMALMVVVIIAAIGRIRWVTGSRPQAYRGASMPFRF